MVIWSLTLGDCDSWYVFLLEKRSVSQVNKASSKSLSQLPTVVEINCLVIFWVISCEILIAACIIKKILHLSITTRAEIGHAVKLPLFQKRFVIYHHVFVNFITSRSLKLFFSLRCVLKRA